MTTKVFVGNLAFQTTDQALAEAFAQCGQVKSGVIITRGRRSLGYGFVDFTTPEDAANAVQRMNQTEFLNRTIKVELVRDPPPRPPRQNSNPASPSNNNNNNQNNNAELNDDGGEGGPASRRRQRKPRRRPRRSDNPSGGPPGENTGFVRRSDQQQQQPQQPYRVAKDGNNNNNNNEAGPNSDAPPPRRKGRGGRVPRERRGPNDGPAAPPKEKILSKTAVFVANLPFSIDDAALANIFEAYHVKTAHVVKTRTERSRGYGFVDFNSEEDQQAAINEKNNTEVPSATGPRKISVTVSHSVAQLLEENNVKQT
jgi:RNA recognition motif-containing protein